MSVRVLSISDYRDPTVFRRRTEQMKYPYPQKENMRKPVLLMYVLKEKEAVGRGQYFIVVLTLEGGGSPRGPKTIWQSLYPSKGGKGRGGICHW